MKKFIIKNKDKYKVLKLAKGLDLQTFSTSPRTKSAKKLGISTKKFGDKWFITPDGKGIFKNYIPGEEIRIVNELLYDNLAKQLGLSVAEYKPAHYGNYNGLISINVAKKNEIIKDGVDILDYNDSCGYNSYEEYLRYVKEYADGEALLVDMMDLKQNLYKILLLDQLTFQEDRHEKNILFVRNNKDGYIKIAPLIDSEMCFANDIFRLNEGNLPSKMGATRFLDMHSQYMNFVAHKEVNHSQQKYIDNAKEIISIAQKNQLLKKIFKKALELDVDKAIAGVEEMGYQISDEYKTFVKDCIEVSTSVFKECINQIKQTKTNSCLKGDFDYEQ